MVILVDFDKTITLKDSTDELVRLYNEEGLKKLQTRFRAKEINIKTYIQEALNMLGSFSEGQFKEDIGKNVPIDTGFQDFLKKGFHYIIVSAGTEENIKNIFEKNNIDIPDEKIFASRLMFTDNGIKVDFIHDGGCGFCGVCKRKILGEYKKKYKKIVYIGDGSSDICAARFADVVFARKGERLARVFNEEGRVFVEYETFYEIIQYLEENNLGS